MRVAVEGGAYGPDYEVCWVVRVKVRLCSWVCGETGMYVIICHLWGIGCWYGGGRSVVCRLGCYWLEGIGREFL